MQLLPLVLVLALASASPSWSLVLGEPDPSQSPTPALIEKWQKLLDTRAIVRIHTPFGTTASGILLPGGTHVLTAAHVTSCIRLNQIQHGLIDFPNADGQRRHWKSVTLHPAGTTAALRKIWDAAVIELDQPIPNTEIPGLPISTKELTPGQLVAFTGFGRRGTGTLGDLEANGKFTLGFNHLDSRLTESQCSEFKISEGSWPLWLHDFDAGAELRAHEAHFASGDSGGAGLILDDQGRTRLVSLNVARHRGSNDQDHRLNGSFGELGLSLDVRALQPWLNDSPAINHE